MEDFDENDDESQFDMSPFEELQGVGLRTELGSDNLHSSNSVVDEETLQPTGSGITQQATIDLTEEEEDLREINDITHKVIKECELYSNPAEILKHLQSKVLTGRQLEIKDPTIEN